jgi:hypothetical protein
VSRVKPPIFLAAVVAPQAASWRCFSVPLPKVLRYYPGTLFCHFYTVFSCIIIHGFLYAISHYHILLHIVTCIPYLTSVRHKHLGSSRPPIPGHPPRASTQANTTLDILGLLLSYGVEVREELDSTLGLLLLVTCPCHRTCKTPPPSTSPWMTNSHQTTATPQFRLGPRHGINHTTLPPTAPLPI